MNVVILNDHGVVTDVGLINNQKKTYLFIKKLWKTYEHNVDEWPDEFPGFKKYQQLSTKLEKSGNIDIYWFITPTIK